MAAIAWHLRLHELALNRTAGAAELMAEAYDCLTDAFSDSSTFDPAAVRNALVDLRFGQPSMAPILNLCAEICYWLDNPDSDTDRTGWINRMRRDLKEQKANAAISLDHLLNRFMKLKIDGERFAFYSWSSTVANGIRAQGKRLAGKRAHIAQSFPGGEGKQTAEFLARNDWQVWLVSDAQLADLTRFGKFDVLILGCDAYSDTHFVNKIGSAALASLMYNAGKRVELWTYTNKRVHPDEIHELDLGNHDPSPSIATGIATPTPLFGVGSMEDIAIIRTPDEDLDPAQLRTQPFRRTHRIPEYLKLENRPG